MPVYTYRREDGTTFDYKQKFSDDPLTVDPESGQRVTRIVQATSIIFKGSGFYVNDSKGKSSTASTPIETSKENKAEKAADGASAKADTSTSDAPKAETTSASKPAKETKAKKAASTSATAD